MNWAEQARQYNKINPSDKYGDAKLVEFLDSCLAGTPGMKDVLTNDIASRKAAGNTDSITMAEYVSLLQLKAQVEDAGKTSTKNPRTKRSANAHDFVFDDEENTCEALQHETDECGCYIHDFDTP